MTQPATDIHALPEPGPEALAHSRALVNRIRDEIRDAGGAVSFRRFMEMALYAPGLGYYSAGSGKLGAGGDFVTAPELSSLFSRCLARQLEPLIGQLRHCVVLEPGAGTGRMAADILAELERRGSLPAAYWILETSADLRERQRQTLAEAVPRLLDRVRWLDALPAEPFDGVVLANEVLDALPCHCIRLAGGEVEELHVAWEEDGLCWLSRPAQAELAEHVRRILPQDIAEYPDGYTSEVNLDLPPFIASLSDVLDTGLMLFVDYGYTRAEYYHPQRTRGTLLCHYRHRVHDDPFRFVGLQDITASVDFTAVAEAADAADLEVRGFTPQAQFLLGGGLDGLLAEEQGDTERALEAARQAKLLTLPGEMGERFKAMALGRGLDPELPAFRLADHRSRL